MPGSEAWLDRPALGPKTVILAHRDCADGMTSAALLLRRLPKAKLLFVHPADVVDALQKLARDPKVGRLVLADLSPQEAHREAIAADLQRILARGPVAWLDHHAPQWPASYEKALRTLGVDVVLNRDETESGASLAAAWAGETDPDLVRIADLIRRRDTWQDPHNPEARGWTLLARAMGPKYIQRLAQVRLAGMEAEAQRLVDQEEYRIQGLLARVRHHNPQVAWLWGDEDISDLADRIFHSDPQVVFLLRFTPEGRVSIRSRPEVAKAAELAQGMGGGGHAHASGFEIPLTFWERLTYRRQQHEHEKMKAALAKAEALAAGAAPQPRRPAKRLAKR